MTSAPEEIVRSLSLRDSEQLLIKLACRHSF